MELTLHKDYDKICIGLGSRRKYTNNEINDFCRLVNLLLKDKRKKISKAKVNKALENYHNGYFSLGFSKEEEVLKLYTYAQARPSRLKIDYVLLSKNLEPEIIRIRTLAGYYTTQKEFKLLMSFFEALAELGGFDFSRVDTKNIKKQNIEFRVSSESLGLTNF